MKKIKFKETKRGFSKFIFSDRYNSKCSIQDSSLATEPAIWLGVDTDFYGKECTRMHLTIDMARELIPILQRFVDAGSIHE